MITKKGGDIDLLIITDKKIALINISKFRIDLIRRIDERIIDILNYAENDKSTFLELILLDAIQL